MQHLDIVMDTLDNLKRADNNTHYMIVGLFWNLADKLPTLTTSETRHDKYLRVFSKLADSCCNSNSEVRVSAIHTATMVLIQGAELFSPVFWRQVITDILFPVFDRVIAAFRHALTLEGQPESSRLWMETFKVLI